MRGIDRFEKKTISNIVMEEFGVQIQKVSIMETEKRLLKRLRSIQNECATNLIYYNKNKEYLKEQYDLNQVPKRIQKIMFATMELRKEIAESLLTKLNQFNKEFNIPITKIEITEPKTNNNKTTDEIEKQFIKDMFGCKNNDNRHNKR